MDRIIVSGIELYAHGGVTPAERETGQRYSVNVELDADLRKAGVTDDLTHTIDYGAVCAVVVETAREREFNLLESVCERIARRLLERFPVQRVTIELRKLLPPVEGVVEYAAVRMVRERADLEGEGPG